MSTIVVLSGGMDSAVLLAHLLDAGEPCAALSVDYGQRHRRELFYAHGLAKHYGVEWRCANLAHLRTFLGGSSQTDAAVPVPHGHYASEVMRATIVPNRNMLLLAIAGAWAIARKADRIAYAAHAGDRAIYPDCRPVFVEALARALFLADDHPVSIDQPFITWTKAEICARGAALAVPFHETYSCYEGAEAHCGQCGTCVERREAFTLAGIPDPTEYAGVTHA